MPLTTFNCKDTPVSDLSILKGMPLKFLIVVNTKVTDLTPLAGMELTEFSCPDTDVSDLSPLLECKSLQQLVITPSEKAFADVDMLKKSLPDLKVVWMRQGQVVPIRSN